MKFLRRALAVLLVFCLAAAPVAARVASATRAQSAAAMVNMASMPDCLTMQMSDADYKTSSQKHCPDCDKDKSCSADECQFKCFKVLAALPTAAGKASRFATHYGQVRFAVPATVNLTPQPPPPRA